MNNPDEKKQIDWFNVFMISLFSLAVIIFIGMLIAVSNDIKSIPIDDPTENTYIEPTETVSEASEPPVTTVCVPVVDPIERELMAIVVYQEAGGDAHCDDCRRRVADVVLNRVADARFPDSIEGVLTQYAQYGMLWKTGIQWQDRADDPDEWHAVSRAYDIAEEVLKGNHSELYGNGYVYQAEFKQGRDGFWCCGTYFGR
jgi:hypothetical protein